MTIKLSDARKSLERAKASAQERLVNLDQERRELKTSIKQLDTALRAISKTAGGASKRHKNSTQDCELAQDSGDRDNVVQHEETHRSEG